MPESQLVAAYIIALNESHNIADAVRSLREATDNVLVVDGGSTDETVERAVEAGAVVAQRPFDDFAIQRNWAIAQLVDRFDPVWIFVLDADERLSPELAAQLRGLQADSPVDVFLIPLRIIFLGRVLRFGGMARTWLPRLFKPGAGQYENRSVNEHFAVRDGAKLAKLKGAPIMHQDVTDWTHHVAKHGRYSTLEARARLEVEMGLAPRTTLWEAVHRPQLRRRWLRQHLFDRMPAKPRVRFVQMYLFSLGFLDGGPGLYRARFDSWQEATIESKVRALRFATTRNPRDETRLYPAPPPPPVPARMIHRQDHGAED